MPHSPPAKRQDDGPLDFSMKTLPTVCTNSTNVAITGNTNHVIRQNPHHPAAVARQQMLALQMGLSSAAAGKSAFQPFSNPLPSFLPGRVV